MSNPASAQKEFIDKCNIFCKLSMMANKRYMNYNGPMFIKTKGSRVVTKEGADGRVMIDLGSFARMNPDYDMGHAKPPIEFFRDGKVSRIDITEDEE